MKERVASAKRVTGYFATKDYSYRSKQVAGDGWVLVGDAFGFLDPLYSSGVLLALKSGELAADAIVEGLAKGDTSAAQLGKWGPAFNQGVDRMRRLVCEYYDGFSFGNFVRNYPDLQGTVTDLLIGDLFTDRVDEVWEPMESLYAAGQAADSRVGRRHAGGEVDGQGQRAGAAGGSEAVSRPHGRSDDEHEPRPTPRWCLPPSGSCSADQPRRQDLHRAGASSPDVTIAGPLQRRIRDVSLHLLLALAAVVDRRPAARPAVPRRSASRR